MATSTRRDLYLSVQGNVAPLTTAMKTGRSVLAEFGGAATSILDEVDRQFGEVGKGGAPGLKDLERAYEQSFRRIGENARRVLAAPTPQAAVQLIDANGTREAAIAAEFEAAALREVALAADRANIAQKGLNLEVRAYAAAAAAKANVADQMAAGLRSQAAALGLVEAQLETTGAAQRRNVAVSGQARAGLQQLGFQLNDVAVQYQAGTSASIIFGQQFPQIIQALQMTTTKTTGFLGVLGGPWGIAITTALAVIAPLVGKLLEGNDALEEGVEKLREDAREADIAAQARKRFSESIEGQIDAQRRLNEELAKGIKTERQRQQEQLDTSRATLKVTYDAIRAQRDRVNAARDAFVTADAELRGTGAGAAADGQRGVLAKERERAVKTLNDAYAEYRRLVAAFDSTKIGVRNAEIPLLEASVAAALDASADAADRYQVALGRLRQQRSAGAISADEFKAKLATEKLALKAAEEAAAAAKRSSAASNRQFGREIDVAGATAIIEGIGGRVTSGIRSTERQAELYRAKLDGRHDGPVAKPGTSAHEAGGRFDAIDVAYGKGISVGSIKQAFAEAGVALRKIINEPGQRIYHVEFARAGGGGPSAETLQRREVAAEQKQVRDADAYARLLGDTQADRLRIERARVESIGEGARLDRDAVDQQLGEFALRARKGAALGQWTEAEAAAAIVAARANAEAEKQLIDQRAQAAVLADALEADRTAIGNRAEHLQLDLDLATTNRLRRDILLKLLATERDQLAAAVARAPDDKTRIAAQAELDQFDSTRPKRQAVIERQTAGPMEEYRTRLIEAVGDIDAAFEGVEARGLQSLEDGLLSVIDGTESVGSAFKKMANAIIADLIRIAVQKLVLSAIGGGGGGGFFGLFADGGKVSGFADGGRIEGFAGGGMIRGPGTGRSDSILALVNGQRPIRVSNGEAIVNERGVRNWWPLIDAINKDTLPRFADGGLLGRPGWTPRLPSLRAAEEAGYGRRDRIELDARVKVEAGPEFDARTERVSARVVGAAAGPIMMGAEERTVKRLNRRRLPGAPG